MYRYRKIQKDEKGMGIMEIILAVAVFAVGVSAIAHMFLGSHTASLHAVEKNQAILLAKEGLEAVRSIRNDDFKNLSEKTEGGIELIGGKWELKNTPEENIDDKFTRHIDIDAVDAEGEEFEVTATVTWESPQEESVSVSLTEHLTNWTESFSLFSGIGESGIETVSENAGWSLVNTSQSYSDPILLVSSNTENEAESPKVGEVRNVSSDSFEVRVCEHEDGSGCDTHVSEDVGWMLTDLSKMEDTGGIDGGKFELSGIDAGGAETINFNEDFSNVPIVIAQIQNADDHEVVVQANNVSTDSMDLYLCDATTTDGCGSPDPYTVGWIAIDPVNNPITTNSEIGTTSMTDSTWTQQNFSADFSSVPGVIATIQTNSGGQQHKPTMARNVSISDMNIRYCEHNGGNVCDSHAEEDVGWIATDTGIIEID